MSRSHLRQRKSSDKNHKSLTLAMVINSWSQTIKMVVYLRRNFECILPNNKLLCLVAQLNLRSF